MGNSLYGAGWTCPNCFAFVQYGESHSCVGPASATWGPQRPVLTEEEKKTIREAIALLEKLLER